MPSYKKIMFLFSASIFCVAPTVMAVNFQESFLQAHEAYKKQDNAKALALYAAIEPKGSNVWFNMGNCAYNLHDYAQALLYWRRAERHADRATIASIAHNIRELEAHIPNLPALQAPSYAYNTATWALSFVPPLPAQILSMLLLVCLLWLMFAGTRKRLLVVMIAALWLVTTGVAYTHYRWWHTPQGLVMKENVALKTGPHPDYHSLANVPLFAQVTITRKEDGWLQVRYNNLVGWLFADTIAEI